MKAQSLVNFSLKPKAPTPMKRILTALVLGALTYTLTATAQEQTPTRDQPDSPPPSSDPAPAPEPAPVPPPTPDPAAPAPETPPAPAPDSPAVPAPDSPVVPVPENPAVPAPDYPTVPPSPAVPQPGIVPPGATNTVGIAATNGVTGTNVVQGTNVPPAQGPNTVGVAPETPATPDGGVPTEPEDATPLGTTATAAEVIPLIQIEDVPLTDAIRNLARQANLNFQFDPRITASNQPNVSIRFENVTAAEALQAVLDNYDLQLVKDPRTRIARISIKDPKAEDPLVSKIIQLRYSDPTNMVSMIKPNLTARSQVIADSRTSQLIVTTTEKEITAVEELVARLDLPTKQVLIEAHIFETSRTPSTIKGVDWSETVEAQNVSFGNNQRILGSSLSVNPTLAGAPVPKILVDTARGFNPATAFLNADGVSAVISFLNKDSETEVVATPRAVTLDNQQAVLSITRAFPIFLITPGSANTPGGSQINYTNLGTILYVTPRIAADNNISLRVAPEVSNIDSVDRKVIQNTVNEANIYAIRRIETHVMIPSGNTLVMGGLINDTKTKSYTKVPLLGDIPVLGNAFRREGKNRNKSNLLIFVTPTIVNDEAFHMSSSGSEFLKTVPSMPIEEAESAWDSAKPHDWTKPVD
jgi:type II secretory pathway component GspD/PulD (secretin)